MIRLMRPRHARRAAGCTLGAVVLATLAACAAPLPTYPPMGDPQALTTIAARMDSVRSISSTAGISLTDGQGRTVSLDGAFVARPPTHARLRAWKMSTPVMDLTVLPEGVWAYSSTRDGEPHATDLARLPASGVSRAITLLSGAFFSGARPIPSDSSAATLVIAGNVEDGQIVRCEIDRPTLTPRRFVLESGGARLEVTLERYTMVGGIVWPRRMRLLSPKGTVVIDFEDTELNGEIAPAAFVPSGRAARIP